MLKQERVGALQAFPFPENGELVEENPPYFCWYPVEGMEEYTVTVKDAAGNEVWRETTDKNYAVPEEMLEPGEYSWNLFAGGCERGEQTFTLSENAVKFVRPTAQQIFDSVPDVRPRHLFFAEDIPQLREERASELNTLRRNIALAYEDGIPTRPMFHRDETALPYREYFGRYRDFCDRDLIACALGYHLLNDEKAGAHAKALLLEICEWNPAGPCSLLGTYGDEVGLSNARCLPAAFDLLYPLLDERQRRFVGETVAYYAQQCEYRLNRLDFCKNPGESHAGRLPAYLGEAALVLKGTGIVPESHLLRWLGYALEIYGGIFPHFGTQDGGWAEGAFYSTSYTRWYLPFFCAVERFSGVRFLDRPFYQRVTQYFLHFASPYLENHPFGDGYWCHSEDTEWPGFFAQNPFRVYADRFGPDLAVKWKNDLAEPDVFLLHLLDVFIPSGKKPEQHLTGEAKNVQAFPKAGFVSMHTNLAKPDEDFAVMARASRFGSDSHRHADQGSFALFYKGKALISPSGYFGRAYGTKHHNEWTNSTRAHNAILIDGVGQERKSFHTTGKILRSGEVAGTRYATLDLSAAYPMLKKWERWFEMTGNLLTITDLIEADHPVTVTYPLHTLSKPQILADGAVRVVRGDAELLIQPMSGGLSGCTLSDQFAVDLNEGVPEEFQVTMPQQYHLSWNTPCAEKHTITVCYSVKDAE